MSKRRITKCPERPELEALLKQAAKIKMTPEMRRAQSRSWAIGELMLGHPEMTRERAEQLVDEAMERNVL